MSVVEAEVSTFTTTVLSSMSLSSASMSATRIVTPSVSLSVSTTMSAASGLFEESEMLTEFMDWNKCLATGLQNQKVFVQIYRSFADASKKRNEYCATQIDETLKPDEIGILLMRAGHQIQFPSDIQIFYVSPPALDELDRWFRDRETKASEE